MRVKIVVHPAEEGGFWAEVPAIPGCASQGQTMDELLASDREAIEACLIAETDDGQPDGPAHALEIAVPVSGRHPDQTRSTP